MTVNAFTAGKRADSLSADALWDVHISVWSSSRRKHGRAGQTQEQAHGCQGSEILARCSRKNATWNRHSRQSGTRTLGPKGRNVVLDKSFGAPRITKDGVTVAKEIELEDKFENMGVQMVREVAAKTSDQAG